MNQKPAWLNKHPCDGCQTGYGECARSILNGMKCCKACNHPGRWQNPTPYTPEELEEMTKP